MPSILMFFFPATDIFLNGKCKKWTFSITTFFLFPREQKMAWKFLLFFPLWKNHLHNEICEGEADDDVVALFLLFAWVHKKYGGGSTGWLATPTSCRFKGFDRRSKERREIEFSFLSHRVNVTEGGNYFESFFPFYIRVINPAQAEQDTDLLHPKRV